MKRRGETWFLPHSFLVTMAEAMEHALFEAERMTLAEALSMYTLEAAYAAHAEERRWGEGWGDLWPEMTSETGCKRGETRKI